MAGQNENGHTLRCGAGQLDNFVLLIMFILCFCKRI